MKKKKKNSAENLVKNMNRQFTEGETKKLVYEKMLNLISNQRDAN